MNDASLIIRAFSGFGMQGTHRPLYFVTPMRNTLDS